MNNDLSRKLARKTQMDRYLAQVSEISGRLVEQDELDSIEETDAIRSEFKKFIDQPKAAFEIKPNDLRSGRFIHFLESLEQANPKPVFIWIERTNVCGAFKLPSVSKIYAGFKPEKVPEGIISFITEDLENSLILDFDDDSVEVELQGPDWIDVRY